MAKVEPMSTVNTPGLAPDAPKEEIPGKPAQPAVPTSSPQPDKPARRQQPAAGGDIPAKQPPNKSP